MTRRRVLSTARALAVSSALLASLPGSEARATGFTDIGDDLRTHVRSIFDIHGQFRLRGEMFYNLDLDRGPTPSGQLFYPVPIADPEGQTLHAGDLRFRTDLAVYAPGGGVAAKVRLDVPDNLALGAFPDGVPSASTSQKAPDFVARLKRAYMEVLTPVGVFTGGRMGNQWGLGILANGGDCSDCDSGDSTDRIAFLSPIGGYVFAVAFDFSASGPFTPRKAPGRVVNVDPSDDVRSVTFAVLDFKNDLARERRRKAGKTTFEYGAYAAYRWQDKDIPISYLPVEAGDIPLTRASVMQRGYSAAAVDGWARLTLPRGRIEFEAAFLYAHVEQVSLLPGALLRQPSESIQFGAAIESDFGRPEDAFGGGIDLGVASGDPAPGFGVKQTPLSPQPVAGDLDGIQANPPLDNSVDNFRFHPDYRVDRILFREIIGTVTDAVYIRPHVRYTALDLGTSKFVLSLTGIASFALQSTSTPGGQSPLGVELDPTIAYRHDDGFGVSLEHGVLFPLAGLDNRELNMPAKPAQMLRVRATYTF